jgi:hypothetical protein
VPATGASAYVRHPRPLLLSLFLLAALVCPVHGQSGLVDTAVVDSTPVASVAPVTSLLAEEYKYDDGEKAVLTWVPSIDDVPVTGTLIGYEIFRITNGGEPTKVADVLPMVNGYEVDGLHTDGSYQFYVLAKSENSVAQSVTTAAITPQREWINWGRGNLMVMTLIICGAVIFFIETARRGRKLYVRKIAGLEAVDEAIGRATEMGRPILYIPGIQDMDDVQTLASLTILGHVAEKVAEYDIKIRMPVSRSLVMTAARETIKAGYQTAGRPDGYSEDMVQYITDEQFGYVAAVNGIMVRERPATVFLLGAFFAESLILAETGNSVGAIQIAGTARPAQLPFFIAACDFTLIGEELFAASAYLSNEPKALGSLKGQDVGKAIAMVAVVVGVAVATAAALGDSDSLRQILKFLRELFTA